MSLEKDSTPFRISKDENHYEISPQLEKVVQKTRLLDFENERHEEIIQIENDINDIKTMFTDIATIVQDQSKDVGIINTLFLKIDP